MIFAELPSKLGGDYSRAHERAEDLLTSTVFGLLRYLPAADGFLPLLHRARVVTLTPQGSTAQPEPSWLGSGPVREVKVDFWPYWPGFGQPDVLLIFLDPSGKAAAVVVVEAKLDSPKSGRAAEDDEELASEDTPDPDQLVRYWQGVRERWGAEAGSQLGVVYLTKHSVPPLDELEASLRRAPGMRLAWLSWCDNWAVAEGLSALYLPGADLARLLAHKGMKYFNGFRHSPGGPPRGRGSGPGRSCSHGYGPGPRQHHGPPSGRSRRT
jgi:hypothetical protein